MSFDPNKPVQTTHGEKARILCIDRVAPNPAYFGSLIYLYTSDKGECLGSCNKDGTSVSGGGYALVNVPEEHTVWINHYKHGQAHAHPSKEAADHYRMAANGENPCLAQVKFTYKEGEFTPE